VVDVGCGCGATTLAAARGARTALGADISTPLLEVEIDALSPTILLGGGGTLDESTDFLLGTGIARGLLGRLDPHPRAAAAEAVRASLAERYEPGLGIPVGTGGWLVSARR
jgi:hypothetical protein